MGLFGKLFGGKKDKAGHKSYPAISPEAQEQIDKALDIFSGSVEPVDGTAVMVVKGVGGAGKVHDGVMHLKQAFELQPDSPWLHFAYASGLLLDLQGKTAQEEMEKLVAAHPDFAPAKLAMEGKARWDSHFVFPEWDSSSREIPPSIAARVKTLVSLQTREGIVPRATVFYRDSADNFNDVTALRNARIEAAGVLGEGAGPRIFGLYLAVYDNPGNPLRLEEVAAPFMPRGQYERMIWEYFCRQTDFDFVVMDHQDRVMLNRRIGMSKRLRSVNKTLLSLLAREPGKDYSTREIMEAVFAFQQKVDPNQVTY